MSNVSLWNLFLAGGPIMWPLLVCSVVGMAVILDRGIFFFRLRVDVGAFLAHLGEGIREGNWEQARVEAQRFSHPVGAVAAAYLENIGRASELRMEIVKKEKKFN